MAMAWIEREDGCLCASRYPVRISRRVSSDLFFVHAEGFEKPSGHYELRDAKDEGERLARQFDRADAWKAPALTGSLVLDAAP